MAALKKMDHQNAADYAPEGALAEYQKALALAPQDVELRERVVLLHHAVKAKEEADGAMAKVKEKEEADRAMADRAAANLQASQPIDVEITWPQPELEPEPSEDGVPEVPEPEREGGTLGLVLSQPESGASELAVEDVLEDGLLKKREPRVVGGQGWILTGMRAVDQFGATEMADAYRVRRQREEIARQPPPKAMRTNDPDYQPNDNGGQPCRTCGQSLGGKVSHCCRCGHHVP